MVNRTIFGTNCSDFCYFHLQQIKSHENKRMVSCVFNLQYLSQNLVKLGVFWNCQDTGSEICPRFVGVIRQNIVQQTYDHNCMDKSHSYQRSDSWISPNWLHQKREFGINPNRTKNETLGHIPELSKKWLWDRHVIPQNCSSIEAKISLALSAICIKSKMKNKVEKTKWTDCQSKMH